MSPKRIRKEVSLSDDEKILIVRKATKSTWKKIVIQFFGFTATLMVSLIALAPLLINLYGDVILTKLFFQTWSRYYPWVDITNPINYGLNGVNIYEQSQPNVTIGLWYIVPSQVQIDQSLSSLDQHLRKYVKSKDQPIIMYLHGQDGTRATSYRSNHYQVMSSFGNHIIALDYRGYGDSTGKPNIQGIVHDVVHVFNRIRQTCPDNPITIWGHSMGTGVGLQALHHLFHNGTNWKKPSGVVLEAPFYNTMQALISYPLTQILKINPYFLRSALDALEIVQINFPNNEIISLLPLPIVIIHAEDDGIIPYYHAQLILEYAQKHRDSTYPPIQLMTVPGAAHCGHNHIYLYEKFRDLVSDVAFLRHAAPQ